MQIKENSFYSAFEEQHRGSRELIKTRLKVYLPYIKLLKEVSSDEQIRAIDLGCGRGEWLELLAQLNVAAHGVDLDEGMLKACDQLGLIVATGEAVAALKALPDNSYSLITAFHLVEHMPFSDLQTLVSESLRVLTPGGLLILETPNPENIAVGTTNFYIDPTHQRPIPQQLLAFLPEFYGYCRVKIMRLQENQELLTNLEPTLLNVLSGVSPDYAVVAQKQALPHILAVFDEVFAQEWGIGLETLAARYQANIQQNFTIALQLAQQSMQQTEARLAAKERQLDEAKALIDAYVNSRSWRITAPLRLLTKMAHSSGNSYRHISKMILQRIMVGLMAHPSLKHILKNGLQYFPGVYERLRRIAHGITTPNQRIVANSLSEQNTGRGLTPHARVIYEDLKKTIESSPLSSI